MKIENLMWLLLPVFMIHEFEEIIMMKAWISKNGADIRKKYPFLASRMLSHFENLSTPAIAFAIALEFVFFSALIFAAMEFDLYALWTAAFLVFFAHVLFHIVTFVVFKKYVPVVVTSLLSLPYGIYVIIRIKNNALFWNELGTWFIVMVLMGVVLFSFALWLGGRFEKWLRKNYAPET